MLTQFKDQAPSPLALAEIFEKTINRVKQIIDARLSYNEGLKEFLNTASAHETKAFFEQCCDVNFTAHFEVNKRKSVNVEKYLNAMKVKMVKVIEAQIADYQIVKKITDKKPHNQQIIDELHFQIFKQYKKGEAIENTTSLTEQGKAIAEENKFWHEALQDVECLMSGTEKEFIDTHEFKFELSKTKDAKDAVRFSILPQTTNPRYLTNRYRVLLSENAQKQAEILGDSENANFARRLFSTILEDIENSLQEYIDSANAEPKNCWNFYRTAYKKYCEIVSGLDEFKGGINENTIQQYRTEYDKKEIRNHKRYERKKQRRKALKNLNETNIVGEEAPAGLTLPEIAPLTLSNDGSTQRRQVDQNGPEEDAAVQQFIEKSQLKTQEWKENVAQKQLQKQQALDAKNKKERLLFEEEKKRIEELSASKAEDEYKNARELLTHLNQGNYALIEQMLGGETPHCKIRYQEIESLFGASTDGKLPGKITSISGSHRKISIKNKATDAFGFFDEFYVDENITESVNKPQAVDEVERKTKSDIVVGGMFKAHKDSQGGSKLSRVAIKMVCATLERVGITAANIARFKQEVLFPQTEPQKPKLALTTG